VGNFEAFARLWIFSQFIFERPKHERQRRTKFVAHIAEEGRFCTVELCQHLGTASLYLIRLCIGDSSADVACDQVEKCPVGTIKHATRPHAYD
jgi:hypothetical protein